MEQGTCWPDPAWHALCRQDLGREDRHPRPGYYKLLANNDLTVTAEGEDGRSFLIGEISFAGFTPDTPEKVVQSLTLIKENPIVGVILLGVTLVSLSVTAVSCSVEININNCKGNCGDQEN